MYLTSKKKKECCGCSACEQVCPQSCIVMKKDEEGFLYPIIEDNSRCLHCGLCTRVCPVNSPSLLRSQSDNTSIHCFYGWAKDISVRKNSTSGAAFYSIAHYCLENGYSRVYGACLESDFSVSHKYASSVDQLSVLIGSKYVQSNTQKVFTEILDELKAGNNVVFSGTPCQVDGVLHFVPEKYRENLLTISLVCHGTACPEVFKTYIEQIEKGKKIKGFKFRDKQIINGVLNQKCTTVCYEDGSSFTYLRDPYVVAFGQGLFSRESCINCKYTTPNRLFDITIGDFWGILNYFPELEGEVERGISLIICHSDKGRELLHKMETMHLEEVPVEYAVNPIQQQLIRPMENNPFRYSFLVSRSKRSIIKRIKRSILMYNGYFFMLRVYRRIRRVIHS